MNYITTSCDLECGYFLCTKEADTNVRCGWTNVTYPCFSYNIDIKKAICHTNNITKHIESNQYCSSLSGNINVTAREVCTMNNGSLPDMYNLLTVEYDRRKCEYFSGLVCSMLIPILINISFTCYYW